MDDDLSQSLTIPWPARVRLGRGSRSATEDGVKDPSPRRGMGKTLAVRRRQDANPVPAQEDRPLSVRRQRGRKKKNPGSTKKAGALEKKNSEWLNGASSSASRAHLSPGDATRPAVRARVDPITAVLVSPEPAPPMTPDRLRPGLLPSLRSTDRRPPACQRAEGLRSGSAPVGVQFRNNT
jgi:hypothetical protein